TATQGDASAQLFELQFLRSAPLSVWLMPLFRQQRLHWAARRPLLHHLGREQAVRGLRLQYAPALTRKPMAWAASGADRPTNRAYGGVMDDEDDIDPSDDPIYRAGVLMGRNQTLTDVMERLFSPDAASAEKTVRAISEWARQTLEEVRVEMRLVF